jgi:hypothetical protein
MSSSAARVPPVASSVSSKQKPDGKPVAQLEPEIANLTDAIAAGLLSASPALAERLRAAESELERLRVMTRRGRRSCCRTFAGAASRWSTALSQF